MSTVSAPVTRRARLGNQIHFLRPSSTPPTSTPTTAAPGAPTLTDQDSILTVDPATFNLLFAIGPFDPAANNPIIGVAAVFVPFTALATLPSDADGFLSLDPATNPRAECDILPAQAGTTVTLEAPDGVIEGTGYVLQEIIFHPATA